MSTAKGLKFLLRPRLCVAAGLWLSLLFSGCGQALSVRVSADVAVLEQRSLVPAGVYSGDEAKTLRAEQGRSFRGARSAKVLINLDFSGSELRTVLTKDERQEPVNFELKSNDFQALSGLKITVVVPGEGTVSRWYPAPNSGELDLELLALLKRPQ